MSPIELVLYTAPECRLCDDAKELIWANFGSRVRITEVDITQSLALKKAYGLKIPVVQNKVTGEKLFWPFDEEGLQGFIIDA